VDGVEKPKACDGKGACAAAPDKTCEAYVCGPDGKCKGRFAKGSDTNTMAVVRQLLGDPPRIVMASVLHQDDRRRAMRGKVRGQALDVSTKNELFVVNGQDVGDDDSHGDG
jgi:hypothetical protein